MSARLDLLRELLPKLKTAAAGASCDADFVKACEAAGIHPGDIVSVLNDLITAGTDPAKMPYELLKELFPTLRDGYKDSTGIRGKLTRLGNCIAAIPNASIREELVKAKHLPIDISVCHRDIMPLPACQNTPHARLNFAYDFLKLQARLDYIQTGTGTLFSKMPQATARFLAGHHIFIREDLAIMTHDDIDALDGITPELKASINKFLNRED